MIDHSKTCAEYFDFFKNHASQVRERWMEVEMVEVVVVIW